MYSTESFNNRFSQERIKTDFERVIIGSFNID